MITHLNQPQSTARQVIRFAGVGIAATAVHVIVALSIGTMLEVTPIAANLAGFAVACLVSFAGHAKVTFQLQHTNRTHLRRFLMLSLISLALSTTVTAIVTALGASLAICMICVGLIVPAGSYIGARFWAFSATAHPVRTQP